MESIINWFTQTLAGIPKEAIILIISMMPILELRGGLIAATLLGVPYLKALLICMIGNIIPIPFVLWLITPIFNWLKQRNFLKGLVEKIEQRTMDKSQRVQKYEFWGLFLFVGIPLPGTGAWTGSLIAAMLNIKHRKAIIAILLGLILAAAIMSFFTYGLPWLLQNI
ncbi:MAG: small multi-drug export protein [Firmicutes bacterium]|nr:small multi-drug export protein [Bacillota bacterium]